MTVKPEHLTETEKVELVESRRRRAQAEMSSLLGAAIDAAGLEQIDIAACCNIAPSKVSKWCSSRHKETPKVHDLALMPKSVARILLANLAGRHDMILCDAPDVEDVGASLLRWVKESSEATTVIAKGLEGDNEIDLEEARAALPEFEEAIAVASAMAARLRQIIAEKTIRPVKSA